MTDDVSNALRDIIGGATTLLEATGKGRTFELYVMTGIARALKALSYDVWIRRSDGSRVRPTDRERTFVQRGGLPTGIPSAGDGTLNASSIAFSRNGRTWEMLNGVTFRGRSQALHEIDIAIVPEPVADSLRHSGGGSPLGRPRVSIECKDVGTNGSLNEMRAFVALLYDISLLNGHHQYLGVPYPARAIHPDAPDGSLHNSVSSYWTENHRTLNVLARRTGFTQGASDLSGYHGVSPYAEIAVGSREATDLMDAVANWIRRRLR